MARTRVYYLIVSSWWSEGKPGSWFAEHFTSIEDAKKWFDANIKSRSKNDGYDDHYRSMEFVVEKYTETRELIKPE